MIHICGMYRVGLPAKDDTLKGRNQIVSNDPTCKDGNARFTMVPLKALFDQV